MNDVNIREVKIEDLERCFEIESVSYAGDEAASKEKIANRISTYPEGFIVLEHKDNIAGFINCGACNEVELSDEEIKELVGHDSDGKYIVILSVVVHPDFQGMGFAKHLMNAFIEKMKGLQKKEIFLICQTSLVDMYKKSGFVYIGESKSDHGGLSWHEMSLSLNT